MPNSQTLPTADAGFPGLYLQPPHIPAPTTRPQKILLWAYVFLKFLFKKNLNRPLEELG